MTPAALERASSRFKPPAGRPTAQCLAAVEKTPSRDAGRKRKTWTSSASSSPINNGAPARPRQKQVRLGCQSRSSQLREHLGRRLERSSPAQTLAVLLVGLALVHQLASRACHGLIQVPNRHTVASIPGDLVLGILVPVHERPSPKQAQTRTCGAVREQYGIQRVEAAFKTIDSINADPNILPNITLGIEIRDSCWHSPIALEQSIEFIRDAMAASEQSAPQLTLGPAGLPSAFGQPTSLVQQQQLAGGGNSGETGSRAMRQQQQQHQDSSTAASNSSLQAQQHQCAPYLKQQLQLQQSAKKIKNLVGVVGPASSGDTVQVQNLLQLFNMPQVGYSATSRDLSNKNFFKYFLRVVPSDKLQARVLIDLMLAHNWTYITVVYTEGSYGSSLMNAFRERAQEAGICFATLESMPPNADDAKFDELIVAIRNHRNARVVVCMCEGRTTGRLFAGFKRQNVSNEYLVVGSDGWADRFDVVEKQEEIALGCISIRIHSAYVHDFDDHYFALNPFNNHRNPWFAEFWEQRFQCNLEYGQQQQRQQQQQTPAAHNRPAFIRPVNAKVYNRTCTGRESLRQNHKQDAKMAFVQKSIITMALGLDSMQRALCGPNRPGLCAEMLPVNGSIFLQHLMNVSFSFLGERVHFDEQGDPPGKYEILNFQRKKQQSPEGAPDDSSYVALPDTPSYYNTDATPTSDDTVLAGGGASSSPSSNRPASYNSYATLQVHRSNSENNTTQLEQRQLARRQLGPVASQQAALTSPAQSSFVYSGSDYSATNSYEYVRVGSWSSSNGLRLFGEIQWPSRAAAFQHYPSLAGGGGGSQSSNGQSGGFGGGGSGSELGTSSSSSATGLQTGSGGISATGEPFDPAGGLGGYLALPSPNEAPFGDANQTVSSLIAKPPKSVCALPCLKGHAKKIQSDSVKCCWVCVPCRPREYLATEFKCKACEKGWWPNWDQTGCDQIPIEYFDWRSLEAMVSVAIAVVGLLLTLATGAVFIKHNETPVVKSTTRELSYMILFSMLVCYSNTFFLIAKPNQTTCFITRILPGFSFAMMYGALVTKTNRIARILAGSKKKIITRRPYFMSATAQVIITWLIVLIECAIIVVMLIREPADKTHEYPSDERVVLVCNTTTMGIMAPLGFDFFLIAMCTLYAFKTRNVPENFNEAKFIGFTMYTTLVIWIAFVVIYLSSEHKVTTLCLCISFSSLFALFLLFFPRCYIIIFKPEKNNRSYFKTTKNVRCHIGYQIGPGSGVANASASATTSVAGGNQSSSGGAGAGGVGPGQTSTPSTSEQHRLFLSSLCEMAAANNNNQEPANNEHYFDELSSQLADELASALASALASDAAADQQQQQQQQQMDQGDKQGQQQQRASPSKGFRGRTSGCKVSPAAMASDSAVEVEEAAAAMASAAATGHAGYEATNQLPVQKRDSQLRPRPTTTTTTSPNNDNNNNNNNWLVAALANERDAAQTMQHDNNGKTATAVGQSESLRSADRSRQRVGSDLGKLAATIASNGETGGFGGDDSTQRESQPTINGNMGPIVHFFGQIRSAFARRSRRKESDKTATIQQHLKAIRHAENLDRQTHFRRSQVQRLIQRFDSNTTCGPETQAWLARRQTNQLQPIMLALGQEQRKQLANNLHGHNSAARFSGQLREFLGDQQNDQFNRLAESDESSRLLAGMSQLIGHENLWRLASVLNRYCKQQQQHLELAPLDLRRAADRRLALVWLRFLIQMAQKALESVQLLVSAAAVPAAGLSAAAGLRTRASLSAQQSRDLITISGGFGGGLAGLNNGAHLLQQQQQQQQQQNQHLPGGFTLDGASKTRSSRSADLRTLRASPSLDNQLMEANASSTKLAGESPVDERHVSLKLDTATTTTTMTGQQADLADERALLQRDTNQKPNGRPAHADEAEPAHDDDPIRRALERITGVGGTVCDTANLDGAAAKDRRHLVLSNKSQQPERQLHATANCQNGRPAKRTLNLNRGDELEVAPLLRPTNTNDKQWPPTKTTGMNEEVVLVANELAGCGDTNQQHKHKQRSRSHCQSKQKHGRDEPMGAKTTTTTQTRTTNELSSSMSQPDDKDEDTRLHFGPASTGVELLDRRDDGRELVISVGEPSQQRPPVKHCGQTRPLPHAPNCATDDRPAVEPSSSVAAPFGQFVAISDQSRRPATNNLSPQTGSRATNTHQEGQAASVAPRPFRPLASAVANQEQQLISKTAPVVARPCCCWSSSHSTCATGASCLPATTADSTGLATSGAQERRSRRSTCPRGRHCLSSSHKCSASATLSGQVGHDAGQHHEQKHHHHHHHQNHVRDQAQQQQQQQQATSQPASRHGCSSRRRCSRYCCCCSQACCYQSRACQRPVSAGPDASSGVIGGGDRLGTSRARSTSERHKDDFKAG